MPKSTSNLTARRIVVLRIMGWAALSVLPFVLMPILSLISGGGFITIGIGLGLFGRAWVVRALHGAYVAGKDLQELRDGGA